MPQSDDHATIARTVFVGEAGQPLRLGQLRGKVVLIDFWGKWCAPCMKEMDSLKGMQQSLRPYGDRIVYVFVSIKGDHYDEDTAWFKQSGLTGANYRWEHRATPQFVTFFSRNDHKWFVPNSIVLNGAGDVVKWVRGSGTDWRVSTDLIGQLAMAAQQQR